MKTPDVIYVEFSEDVNLAFEKQPFEETPAYIRKDALLDWIKDQLKENAEWREVNPDDRFLGGKEVTFNRIIDKINSL